MLGSFSRGGNGLDRSKTGEALKRRRWGYSTTKDCLIRSPYKLAN